MTLLRRAATTVLAAAMVAGFTLTAPAAAVPFWHVATVSAETLRCLVGSPAARIGVLACHARCEPIPWQLDERNAAGDIVLDEGPAPIEDDAPRVIDGNDVVAWMAEDGGRRIRPEEVPSGALCGVELRLHVTIDGTTAGGHGRSHTTVDDNAYNYVYAFLFHSAPSAPPAAYVRYDASSDAVVGMRATLGFRGPTPEYFAVAGLDGDAPRNLIDRLKVRATAWFLGVIPMDRDEGDLQTEVVAWHAGPIRVIRRQEQRIDLGWGIRSPRFVNDSYVSRDSAELPVRLRLNFPPTYFFRSIDVRAYLDYRDLRGWRILAPGLPEPLHVGALSPESVAQLNRRAGEWVALLGPHVTLVQILTTSPSLSHVRRRLYYRETTSSEPPEAVAGEMPAVGYRFTDWSTVGSGHHWFASTNYVLPAGYDVATFLHEQRRPTSVETSLVPNRHPPSGP